MACGTTSVRFDHMRGPLRHCAIGDQSHTRWVTMWIGNSAATDLLCRMMTGPPIGTCTLPSLYGHPRLNQASRPDSRWQQDARHPQLAQPRGLQGV